MQSPPSSVISSLGGFDFHYYGLIMFISIITALWVIKSIAKKHYKTIDTEVILDILPLILLSSILGARLYYVILDLPYFIKYPEEILAIWNGGMSIHGGIIGGLTAGFILAKIKQIKFLKYADVFSYGLIIGQAIGRLGNWFNCEAFGKPCSIPLIKLYIPAEHRPFGYEQYQYFHPTFLYESIWNISVFLILFFVIRKITKIKDGTIFFSYLILYSLGRFFIEWCRIDSVLNLGPIHFPQIVSLIVIFVSTTFLFNSYREIKKR